MKMKSKCKIFLCTFFVCVLVLGGNAVAISNFITLYDFNHSLDQNPCKVPLQHEPFLEVGAPAFPGEFPWIVNLRINGNAIFCNGVLIDLDLVLTAATCLIGIFVEYGPILPVHAYPITSLHVFAGDIILQQVEPTEQLSIAQNITLHPKLSLIPPISHDLAVIELSKPFTETKYVRPIPLPEIDRTKNNGTNATIAGWAPISMDADISGTLGKIHLRILTESACYEQTSVPVGSRFCTGGKGIGSCHGEIGGPLICDKCAE